MTSVFDFDETRQPHNFAGKNPLVFGFNSTHPWLKYNELGDGTGPHPKTKRTADVAAGVTSVFDFD